MNTYQYLAHVLELEGELAGVTLEVQGVVCAGTQTLAEVQVGAKLSQRGYAICKQEVTLIDGQEPLPKVVSISAGTAQGLPAPAPVVQRGNSLAALTAVVVKRTTITSLKHNA